MFWMKKQEGAQRVGAQCSSGQFCSLFRLSSHVVVDHLLLVLPLPEHSTGPGR